MNTLDLSGIHLKEHYRIPGNTQEYSKVHMNLQVKPNEFLRKNSLRKTFEFTGIYRNTHKYPIFEG